MVNDCLQGLKGESNKRTVRDGPRVRLDFGLVCLGPAVWMSDSHGYPVRRGREIKKREEKISPVKGLSERCEREVIDRMQGDSQHVFIGWVVTSGGICRAVKITASFGRTPSMGVATRWLAGFLHYFFVVGP